MKRILPLIAVLMFLIFPVSCSSRKQSPPQKNSEQNESKGYIVYINADTPKNNVMYSVDIKGKNKQKIYEKNPYNAVGYGPKIAFVADDEDKKTLYMINADKSSKTTIMGEIEYKITSLSWSPNSKRIAYTMESDSEKGSGVFYVEAGKHKTPVSVASDEYINKNPKFSNDGRMIVYTKDTGSNADIIKYDMPTKTSTSLPGSGNQISPVVTPDGTKILYLSDEAESGKYNLYMMNIEGGDRTALTMGMNIEAESIKVSPDNSMVAFVTVDEKGNKAVQVMDMHKSPVMVANGGYLAAWSSDSKKLYFASFDPKSRRIVEYDISVGTMRDVLNIEYKPGEEAAGIRFLHYTDELK